jgi:hypothetical protein
VGSGSGSGHAYATAGGPNAEQSAYWTVPATRVVSETPDVVEVTPVANTGGSVAVWTGDDATFMLQGLRLARVNNDLAENLGVGSERGFLVLDTGRRWTGLRAGDVLLEIDGRAVRDGTTARIVLGSGDDHRAEVIREGQRRTIAVEMR